jgi:cation:H+ antiporter
MTTSVVIFFMGAGLLYVGAEGLIRGSIYAAKALGIRPVVIGLTVVAFGTSAPEFIVSLVSVFSGSSDIALGNVVGSNIANIGLILGIAALLRPVGIDTHSLRFFYPVLFISSVILYTFALGDSIGFFKGIFLLIGLVGLIWYLIGKSDAGWRRTRVEKKRSRLDVSCIIYIVGGAVLLLLGSHLMVDSGTMIARALGVSEFAIGVTLIAVGTSLPELAATIVSVLKRNTGIVLGNIIGSNIFNVLFVIGGVSVLHPIAVAAPARLYEFPVMIGFSVILYIFMRTGFTVNRTEGVILLAAYCIFIIFLF